MPELPEVRTVKNQLQKALESKIITKVVFNNEKLLKEISLLNFKKNVEGEKVIKIDNRSKFLLIFLENKKVILSHLRMTGKYRLEKNYKKEKHDHVLFKLKNRDTIVYNDSRAFGTFHLRNVNDLFIVPPLSNVAPVTNDIDINVLYEKLKKKKIAIKTAMLDQKLVAGLGNIYINEALWFSKISPKRPSNSLSKKEVEKLINFANKIMDESTRLGGTTIYNFLSFNQIKGEYQKKLKIHNKKNQLCPRDNKKIIYEKINGRGTFWCKHCQK